MGKKTDQPVKLVAGDEASDDEVPDLEGFEFAQPPMLPPDAGLDVAFLQREIEAAQLKQLRSSIPLFKPLYAKREKLIQEKLKEFDFWPRVLSGAPKELDDAILPTDATILGTTLRNVNVERVSVDDNGEGGDPRDVKFVFEFDRDSEENEWFEGSGSLKLEKTFYWRKHITKAGGHRNMWEGFVSKPVRIPWKKDADPTKGLLDAACDLYDAEQKTVEKNGKKITGADRTALPQYEKLVQEIEKVNTELADAEEGEGDDDSAEPARTSFFCWFGYRGRDVTVEESEAAMKEDDERWAKLAKGEELEDEQCDHDHENDEYEEDDGDEGLDDAEICPEAQELTQALSENVWPKALAYFGKLTHSVA
ncbi:hypothetical protein KEM55_009016 [Ascosphaera atra]|nr:hypothetical protein KEM55_009016 [Ascosphaera atra]